MEWGSTDVAKAAIQLAISSRSMEEKLIKDYKEKGSIPRGRFRRRFDSLHTQDH